MNRLNGRGDWDDCDEKINIRITGMVRLSRETGMVRLSRETWVTKITRVMR